MNHLLVILKPLMLASYTFFEFGFVTGELILALNHLPLLSLSGFDIPGIILFVRNPLNLFDF
jgi:hypothetical protein